MDTKDFKGLMEAYAEVHIPQEVDEATAMTKRGHDETAIRQKIAKSTGGGEAADRATALEKKPTYGDKNKEAQRSRYARAQRGDFRNTTSSNPGLHGYGHQSNDPKVKAKQAARGAQRGSAALTPKEKEQLNMEMEYDVFDMVMEFLYVEGYAETLEDAEWMMANLIDEEAIDIILGEEQLNELSDKKVAKTLKARERRFDRSVDSGAPNKEFHQLRRTERLVASRNKRTGSNIPVDEAIDIILGEAEVEKSPYHDPKTGKVMSYAERQKQLKDKAARASRTEEYVDEAITSEKGKAKAAEMIANRTTASGRAKPGQGANVATIKHIGRSNRDGLLGTPPNRKVAGSNWPKSYSGIGGTGNKAARRAAEINKEAFEAWLDEAMSSYERNRKRAAARAEARNAARDAGKTGVVPGVGYVSPRREKISLRDKFGDAAGTRMAKAKPPSGDEKY